MLCFNVIADKYVLGTAKGQVLNQIMLCLKIARADYWQKYFLCYFKKATTARSNAACGSIVYILTVNANTPVSCTAMS